MDGTGLGNREPAAIEEGNSTIADSEASGVQIDPITIRLVHHVRKDGHLPYVVGSRAAVTGSRWLAAWPATRCSTAVEILGQNCGCGHELPPMLW